MLLYLQIALTILSALCVAGVIPLGVWLGWNWAIALALTGALCFGCTLLCKQTLAFRAQKNTQNREDSSANDEEESSANDEN